MHVFVSKKPLSPVRWHQAFTDSVTVRQPSEVAAICHGDGVIWLDFTRLSVPERIEWLAQVKQLGQPVVVLSNVPNDNEALQVFRAGAAGYCHVLAVPDQLREIALVVEHGGHWVGARFIEKLISVTVDKLNPDAAGAGGLYDQLTEREQMVASEVARGATNREIADALGITERTVKAHLSSIFAKSGARDRIQLVLMLKESETSVV